MGLRRVVGVLGQLQQVERVPRVAGGAMVILLRGGQPGLRPVEPCAHDRVVRLGRHLQGLCEQLLGRLEVRLVDERVREQDGEADRLDGVLPLLGRSERALEEDDRHVELVDRRVGSAERVRPARVVGEIDVADGPRLLQPGDRLARLPLSVGELPQPDKRASLLLARRRLRKSLGVQLRGVLPLVEAQADLGFHEYGVLVMALASRREVVLTHSEAPAHLAQELERRDAVARLDAGNVGGRATRERELALAQPRPFAGFFEPSTNLDRVVDMG